MAYRCGQRLSYFQRSIKHSLSEESKKRLEFTDWKSTTAVIRNVHLTFTHASGTMLFYGHKQACILPKSPFFLFLVSLTFSNNVLSLGLSQMDASGWAGVELSLFPVQTLGELGLGRGEIISCSNCKVNCMGVWGTVVFVFSQTCAWLLGVRQRVQLLEFILLWCRCVI